MQPTLQTAHEYEGAARDFVDFSGAFPSKTSSRTISSIIATRRTTWPQLCPSLIAPFLSSSGLIGTAARTRHALALPRSKKRIRGIQALLSFAKGQKWITRNAGRDVPVMGYTKSGTVSRQTFQEDELSLLFTSRLFTAPPYCGSRSLPSAISDACLCWSAAISDNDSTASPAFCSIRNRSISDRRG